MDSRMHTDPDGDLILRVGAGERAAAQILMARHLPKMLSLAQRMLAGRAPNESEDVVQEAFLKVWQFADRWKPGKAKFETWLYRVVLNLCYDRLRKRRLEALDAAADIEDDTPPPDREMEAVQTASEVQTALSALPERQRIALVLCHFEELGNVEASEILGVSVEALESLLARGRRTLRARLQHLRTG